MDNFKLLDTIKNNPNTLAYIDNPTDEMKLLAVSLNGLMLSHIKYPTREMQEIAIGNNPRAIQYIDNPTEDMMLKAIKNGWTNLAYIKNPSAKVIKVAINQSGWAIQYLDNPNEDLQLLAVRNNYDAIKYIKNPCPKAQEEAVNISYDALRYIPSPTPQAELIAIKNNERAINFVNGINKNKIFQFLKVNILVIKYLSNDITLSELEIVLKETLRDENITEKYVRDFTSCREIDKNSALFPLDKLSFIYQYGSKKAKKIAVDEKLKML